MQVIRVKWTDNGQERSLLLVDPGDLDVIKWAYAAADAVHIPIGDAQAYSCTFEPVDDGETLLRHLSLMMQKPGVGDGGFG